MPGLQLKVLSPLQRALGAIRKETDCSREGSEIQRTLNIRVPSPFPPYFPEALSPKPSFQESHPRSPQVPLPTVYTPAHTLDCPAPCIRHAAPAPRPRPHSTSANELCSLGELANPELQLEPCALHHAQGRDRRSSLFPP